MSLIWDRLFAHKDTRMQKKDTTEIGGVLNSSPQQQIYALKSKDFSKKLKPAVLAEREGAEGSGASTPPPARGEPALPLSASFEARRAGGQP